MKSRRLSAKIISGIAVTTFLFVGSWPLKAEFPVTSTSSTDQQATQTVTADTSVQTTTLAATTSSATPTATTTDFLAEEPIETVSTTSTISDSTTSTTTAATAVTEPQLPSNDEEPDLDQLELWIEQVKSLIGDQDPVVSSVGESATLTETAVTNSEQSSVAFLTQNSSEPSDLELPPEEDADIDTDLLLIGEASRLGQILKSAAEDVIRGSEPALILIRITELVLKPLRYLIDKYRDNSVYIGILRPVFAEAVKVAQAAIAKIPKDQFGNWLYKEIVGHFLRETSEIIKLLQQVP